MNFNIIPQLILGLLGLSFLVFIHELGHFLVARATGVRVNVFSIGFGKKLFKIKRGNTVYCLSAIPFGGYVAMAGENPANDEFEQVQPDHFQAKSIKVRAAIAFGGPFINVVFAFIILTILYMVGVQEPIKTTMVVGEVYKESAGEIAGVAPGDIILAVNNAESPGWQKFRETMSINIDTPVALSLLRGVDTLNVIVTPREFEEFGIGSSGIAPESKVIAGDTPILGSPASNAGIQKFDQIDSINGIELTSVSEMIKAVKSSEGNPITLSLMRKESDGSSVPLSVVVIPIMNEKNQSWWLNLRLSSASIIPQKLVTRNFGASVVKAFGTSVEWIQMPFIFIKKLFQGALKPKALSGPVGIVQILGSTWMLDFSTLLFLLALISMNLGIMNLLPLAITDGGMLLFFAIEAVRGKPLPRNVQAVIQQIAIIFFITLFAYILWQDMLKFNLLTVPK